MSSKSLARRIGVLLAAGRGRRMGQLKQLVSWPSANGPKPLVAAAYDAIRGICGEMVVVLGHESNVVATALHERTFQRIECDPDAPMFASICAGLSAAQEIDRHAFVVLHPGDHPQVGAETLEILVTGSLQRPHQAIIPEYENHGGHPVIIPPAVAARILEVDCPTGLGDFWKANPEHCLRVALDDPTVCLDIDTPTDLSKAGSLW